MESHPTKALIHLENLTQNLRLVQAQVGERPLWLAIKANAYGHAAGKAVMVATLEA